MSEGRGRPWMVDFCRRSAYDGLMNASPVFAFILIVVLLIAVAVGAVIVGFFKVAMVIGPFLLIGVILAALMKAGASK